MRLATWSKLALAVAAVGTSLYIVFVVNELGGVDVPRPERVHPENLTKLNEAQGWPDGWGLGQADWFHHASQGTRILPYAWFINLEQPALISPGKIVKVGYLERFGFLPSKPEPKFNPDGLLPIGFAIDRAYDAPYAQPPWNGPVVGLTCAACHTGQLTWRDEAGVLRGARIEGGSAMIHLGAFQDAVGRALGFTLKIGPRFERFARGVLGDRATGEGSAEAKQALRADLQRFLDVGLASREYARVHKLAGTESGFGRTDALGLIGNRVFGALNNENLAVPDAPVNFPPLWDTAWFDWVQYNASIRMPMVRNIGEALGVGASVDLDATHTPRYASTVDVGNLHRMEDQLGGTEGLSGRSGLQSPRWEDAGLPDLNPERVKRGRNLYVQFCQECHRPPMDELKADLLATAPKLDVWEVDEGSGMRFLKLVTCDLREIGTDPNQAMNLYRRVAVIDGATISAARGLYAVTEFIRRDKYGQLEEDDPAPFDASLFDRFRTSPAGKLDDEALVAGEGIDQVIVANLKYKARPLDGIWATPPFLHNGSVPNLDELLSPVDRREASFTLGTTRFDPVRVGFVTDPFPGGTKLDTTLPGNRNLGHEFRNLTLEELEQVKARPGHPVDPPVSTEGKRWSVVLALTETELNSTPADARKVLLRKRSGEALESDWVRREHPFPGVIGPAFTDDERLNLIEFLKSL